MPIHRLHDAADSRWLALRRALWDDSDDDEHRREIAEQSADPARYAAFLAVDGDGGALGLAEAALRHDYVNGTDSSPVLFLEGLFVQPAARRQGLARALVDAVADWGRTRGCREMASDAPLDNTDSQAMHARLGFVEAERVVCFVRPLDPASEPAPDRPSDTTLGHCLCGAVQLRAALPARWVAHCHCTMCQRAHGAGVVTWAGFDEHRVHIDDPQQQLRWYASSAEARRAHCARCGTPIAFASSRWPPAQRNPSRQAVAMTK